jgi:hypothetical protein
MTPKPAAGGVLTAIFGFDQVLFFKILQGVAC